MQPAEAAPPLVPGQLGSPWRTMFIAGWIGTITAWGCVWQACRIAGIAPWWLGPETNVEPFFLVALPFVGPIASALAGIANLRYACYLGLVAGAGGVAISLGDAGRYQGMALVEAVIGIAGICVSAACLAGRMVAAADPADDPAVEAAATESV